MCAFVGKNGKNINSISQKSSTSQHFGEFYDNCHKRIRLPKIIRKLPVF